MRLYDSLHPISLFVAMAAIIIPLSRTSAAAPADEPAQGVSKVVALGKDVTLEVVYIPPGEFKMGSTAAEKAWATWIEGGATPGTER